MTTKLDIQRAREDVCYFAERLLDFKLHDFQRDVLTDVLTHLTTVHVASRGAGKTLEAGILTAFYLFCKTRATVVYCSAQDRQSKRVREVISDMILGTPLAREVEDQSTERIKSRSGSVCYFVPGQSEVALRGWHPARSRRGKATDVLLILDESGSIPEAVYVASAGILSAAKPGHGRKLLLGTPTSKKHFFYREYRAGLDTEDKTTASHRTPVTKVQHVLQSGRVEELQKKLLPHHFAQEYLAEFQDDIMSFFGEHVRNAVSDYKTPLEPDWYGDNCQHVIGIDLSSSSRVGSDFTVLVVLERWHATKRVPTREVLRGGRAVYEDMASGIRVAEIRRAQYMDIFTLRRELGELTRKYKPVRYVVEDYQSMGLQQFLPEKKLEIVSVTNKSKRLALEHTHMLLRDKHLLLPKGGEHVQTLINEMEAYERSVTESGTEVFSAPPGEHDDTVSALYWGLSAFRFRVQEPARAYYRKQSRFRGQ